MIFKRSLAALLAILVTAVCFAQDKTTVSSPNKNIVLNFWLNESGTAMYEVTYKSRPVILPSAMGFELKETMRDTALPSLRNGLSLISKEQSSSNTTWKPVWGDVKEIRDNYTRLTVKLDKKSFKNIEFAIVFKVFDDGVGFRYEFPVQKNMQHFIVSDERTEFHLSGNHKAFWMK